MSTTTLPRYSPVSFDRAPSYTTEPQFSMINAQRYRPSGVFIKESKGGGVILRLGFQEDNVELPTYGLGSHVEGTIGLPKTDPVERVEVKIEGRLVLQEIGGSGSASVNLCRDLTLLWSKDTSDAQCPHSLPFSLPLPDIFTYEGMTYPLPPSFDVKLSGLPGFSAAIEYSVTAVVAKPFSIPIPTLTVKALGIHFGTIIVSTTFAYYPRSRPAKSLPAPLQYLHSVFEPFKATSEWELHESNLQSRSTSRPDIVMKLYLPASRTFSITQPIPFYLTVESTASVSLAAFLPFSPTGNSPSARKVTRIQLVRQSTVDIQLARHGVMALTKGEMWRTDCIGEGTFTAVSIKVGTRSRRTNKHKANPTLGFRLNRTISTPVLTIQQPLKAMPFRKISKDVKIAAMRMYDADLLPLPTILDFLNMSRRTFFRVRALWIETGNVVQQTNGVKGRPRLNHFSDIDYLKRLIKHRPDWFVDEMQYLLQTNRFISVHYMTIHRELVRAGISTKKIKKIASERNENLRADYVAQMAQYTPDQLGFLDEVSKDERTLARARGRSRKGIRAVQKGVFVRGRRFSALGLLTLDGMVSNTVVEGSMTRELFLEYLEFTVMPLCSAFPGSLSVLVMDNARIHHGEGILELAERFHIRVEFLPPYSPDPIEEAFSKVKVFIRRHARLMSHQGDGMIFELMEIMNVVSNEDAIGYFLHAGYF